MGAADDFGGSYTLHVEGTELAPTLTLLGGLPEVGAIETPGDTDYFRFEIFRTDGDSTLLDWRS